MSDTPKCSEGTRKPREFWILSYAGETIVSENKDHKLNVSEEIHVVEHSALVAAQAEIVDTVHRAQDTIMELKTEIERLTNQYNEQLDLARHRAVELEKAKITYDANLEERLEMRAELERANTSLLDMTMDRDRFKKRHAEQKEQADELELMADFYRSKLVEIANEDGGPMEGSITARKQRDIARAALKERGEK